MFVEDAKLLLEASDNGVFWLAPWEKDFLQKIARGFELNHKGVLILDRIKDRASDDLVRSD